MILTFPLADNSTRAVVNQLKLTSKRRKKFVPRKTFIQIFGVGFKVNVT